MSTEELRADVRGLMPQAKRDLAELVSMRSVADPDQFPPEECERAAQWLIDAFSKVGLRDLAAHETPDGSKAVFGQAPAPPGAPTVLLYCHYDVQPPLDDDGWETPVFELTEKDGRWYGRGSADCKGNVVMHLTALRALGGGAFPVGVKLIAEGSEEQGTGGLEAYARRHPDLLRADTILICDAGNSAVGVPTLTTTLRGIANVVVTVQTLRSAMHSGMFGGAAPDALQAMIQILSTLRDEHGNTTVRGLDNTQRWDGVQYPSAQTPRCSTVSIRSGPARSRTCSGPVRR
jgi:acetylornithine deacetylase/succinyl-diaminopimelate desuccinylase-like protein